MRAPIARICIAAVAASALCGCGYGPARTPKPGFCVLPAESRHADAIAQSSLVSGLREGLASAGALGVCPTSRRVRVEIVRTNSAPVGAVQAEGGAAARGMLIRVAGRATVELPQGPWSTEFEGEATVGGTDSVVAAAQTEADGRARAARQAGLGLAERLSALPEPAEGS